MVPPGDAPDPNSPAFEAPADSQYVDPATEFRTRLTAITPRVLVTYVLLAINIAVFVAMVIAGAAIENPKLESLIRAGADFGPLTITNAEWWRMLTSMFIHIGIIHLAFNMFVLLQIGPFVEKLTGNVGFSLIYIASGLAGALASLAWSPYVVSAGASGAIFGLYGALLGFLAASKRDSIPTEVLSPLRQSALVFIGYNAVFGFIRQGTDVAAHAGGLAAGFLCGLAVCVPLTLPENRRRHIRNVIVAVAAAVITIGIGMRLPRPVDLTAAIEKFTAAESKTLAAYNGLLDKTRKENLADDVVANGIEKDVLPGWRLARTELTSLKGLPATPQKLVASLSKYSETREAAWVLFAQALRRHDSNLVEQANVKQREADSLAKSLRVEPK
jgi:rhomboid protease GluP